jgi:transcriptional regulator with XRE-family HTH domain
MSISSNLAFGPRLRAHRERRGITLGALAESIKIKPSLLEGLERNDVSRWPPGIYRRALVREYAKAIGLPANATLEEFCELFPEPEKRQRATPLAHTSVVTGPEAELRLTFASTQTPRIYGRLFGAVAELAGVLTTGFVVTLIGGFHFWTVSGIVGLIWYPATAVLRGAVALYPMPRWQRSSILPAQRPTSVLANLMSIVMPAAAETAAGRLIIEPDVHAPPSASASVH